jgi:hypothetical protein
MVNKPEQTKDLVLTENGAIVPIENIQSMIFTIRGAQVMVDSDLAKIYGVELRRLNEQVKRNIERFPDTFRFQLTKEEYENLMGQSGTSSARESLRCQIGTLKDSPKESLRSQIATLETGRGQHRKYLPYVFTEQGVSMLSAVLRSQTAVKVSIKSQIYTRAISKQLALDLKKHNQQYPPISIETFKNAHDRFLILDGEEIYHIGASLKDLGKKWFAFSRFETGAVEMLKNLEGL